MLLGTTHVGECCIGDARFQSPERIHAFGNMISTHGLAVVDKFQSPERIHAFGNRTLCLCGFESNVSIPREDSCFWERERSSAFGLRQVSIPREDSCFWELTNLPTIHSPNTGFNPQRGFMLLGTCTQ